MIFTKFAALLSVLFSNPREFFDRLEIKVDYWRERMPLGAPIYDPMLFDEAIYLLKKNTDILATKILNEPSLTDIESSVREGTLQIQNNPAVRLSHSADINLARLCYVMCRAIRPRIVIETGVCYGVTSAFILKALEANQHGELHSIDLPPLARGGDEFVGSLIPDDLRHRWQLHRGTSKKILPNLLKQLGSIDIFIHDSLHTYQNMKFEFDTAAPFLTEQSVVIADDIDENRAFREWVDQTQPSFWVTVREAEKSSILGMSMNINAGSNRSQSATKR
ncbi:MAG: class I SAM-dependent methyltransferase [Spirochaetes bacterium]|nr:class I SAM-dependent methyltransferase [Spirochaetota bacterium]